MENVFLEGIAAWQELIAWSWAASPSLQQRLWPATAPKSIFVHKMWLSYVCAKCAFKRGRGPAVWRAVTGKILLSCLCGFFWIKEGSGTYRFHFVLYVWFYMILVQGHCVFHHYSPESMIGQTSPNTPHELGAHAVFHVVRSCVKD